MSHRIPIPPEPLPGMTTGHVVQMRDHLAQTYDWRFGTQVPFDVFRHAGNQAIAATLTATAGPTETMALADLLSHQIKGATLQTGQASTHERIGPWHKELLALPLATHGSNLRRRLRPRKSNSGVWRPGCDRSNNACSMSSTFGWAKWSRRSDS